MSAGPAAAASHNVGTRGELSRCFFSPYNVCLYYHGDGTGAYWGLNLGLGGDIHGDANLGDNHFISGSGDGAGLAVRNRAAAMDCGSVTLGCWSYVSPDYAGNFDYAAWGTGGTLFFTWNNGASIQYL